MIKALVIIITVILVFPAIAYSQEDLQRAASDVDRPIREEVEELLKPPPQEKPKIKEEPEEKKVEGPKFFIKKIKLIGCESFPPEDFKHLLEEYENKEVSLEELKVLAKKIEREYLKKGIVAACFIPPQEIKEGMLTLHIIEARMGSLQIKDHRFFNKKRISYYWELKPGEILEYYKISKSLQFINRNPDREAQATLFAGKKPGTTDVSLDVKTHFPLHIIASYDREGTVSTGKDRWGFGIRHNNILGLDDTVLAGYSFGKHSDNIYAYHSLPLTSFGTTLMYGFTRSESFPKKDFESFDLRSYAKTGSCFIYQDIYKKDRYLGEIQFGIDGKDKTVYTKDGVLTRDRLRVLRFGGELVIRWLNSVTHIKPMVSQGINLFGARRKSEFSSRDAENTFTKANIEVRYRKPIAPAFQINVKTKVQFASEKLPPQEGFSFGGMNSVRGYPTGDYYADNAIQVNTEFLVPPLFLPKEIRLPYAERPLKEDVTGLMFFDYGYGTKRGKRQGERDERRLAGIGLGLRVRLFNQALLRLEWGFPIKLGDKPLSETAKSRFYVSLNFQDRIPEEIERIRKMIERENIEQAAWNILDRELKRPGSYLRERLYGDFYMAEAAHEKNDFKTAKEYYEKVFRTGDSLYKQILNYVERRVQHKEELKERNKLAMKYYKEGKFKEAKELWEKTIEEAEAEPLSVEF